MLEAKNVEKNKIIMMLADELIHLSEHDKWSRRLEFARGFDAVPSSTRCAPDFNCTTVEKYLSGGTECTPEEKVGKTNVFHQTPAGFDSYEVCTKIIGILFLINIQKLSYS